MMISHVIDMELKFDIHVIEHKIHSSIQLNIISCEAVNFAYKVVRYNLSFDLAKLLLNQFNKNMKSIRWSNNYPYKFRSLLTCLFFFYHKFFPSKVTI